MQAVCKSMQLF